jgi:hypothetical protein
LPLVQAAVIYILVNDYREATYFIRAVDAKGALLDGKHCYAWTFPKRCAAVCRPLVRHRLVADDTRQALFHAAETSQPAAPTSAPKTSTPTH